MIKVKFYSNGKLIETHTGPVEDMKYYINRWTTNSLSSKNTYLCIVTEAIEDASGTSPAPN